MPLSSAFAMASRSINASRSTVSAAIASASTAWAWSSARRATMIAVSSVRVAASSCSRSVTPRLVVEVMTRRRASLIHSLRSRSDSVLRLVVRPARVSSAIEVRLVSELR